MIGIIIMTGIALLLSVLLVTVSHFLGKQDELIVQIENHLPGYNCGACGYGSCHGMALQMLAHPEVYVKCRPMREDARKRMKEFVDETLKPSL